MVNLAAILRGAGDCSAKAGVAGDATVASQQPARQDTRQPWSWPAGAERESSRFDDEHSERVADPASVVIGPPMASKVACTMTA